MSSPSVDIEISERVGRDIDDPFLHHLLANTSPGAKSIVTSKLLSQEIVCPMDPTALQALFDYACEESQGTSALEYDVMITDITDGDLADLGTLFGIARLSVVPNHIPSPSSGMLYGSGSRSFVLVSLQAELSPTTFGPIVVLPMIYDSGSPFTFLRADTLRALYPTSPMLVSTGLIKNFGFPSIVIHRSRHHFENVDVIGQDAFLHMRTTVTTNYESRKMSVEFRVS